jgi:hypothetical protein
LVVFVEFSSFGSAAAAQSLSPRFFLLSRDSRDGFAFGGINVPDPATTEELFEAGARNEEVPDGPANAEFLAKLANTRLGKTQEMTKLPIVEALALAGHIAAMGNDGLDDSIKGKAGHRCGVVNLAGPETELAPSAHAAGHIPHPQITPALD